MSNDKPLTGPIEGYELNLSYVGKPGDFKLVKTIPLRLGRTGGAHITNKEDLIRLIEDAVFNNEKEP